MKNILAIDIGGTKTQVAIVSTANHPSFKDYKKIKILHHRKSPTPKNPNEAINLIFNFYKSLNINVEKMSISLPGLWNDKGVLIESNFLKEWIGFPFIKKLSKKLDIKKYTYETDVICGGLGEYYAHIETLHAMSLLYINLGTGVGASLIRDGKPFVSKSGLTLRLQKMIFPNENKFIPATNLISGGYLSKHKTDLKKSQMQLACWLVNLYYLFAPDLIVLNGGLTYDWDLIAKKAITLAKKELKNKVKILPSKLKEMAPIYGALVITYRSFRTNAQLALPS